MLLLIISATDSQSNKHTNKIQPYPPHHCKLGLYLPCPSTVLPWIYDQESEQCTISSLGYRLNLSLQQLRSNCGNLKQWETRYHHFGIRCPPPEESLCDSSFKTRLKNLLHLYLIANHTLLHARHGQIYRHRDHPFQSMVQQSPILDLGNERKVCRTDGYANKSEVLPAKALNKWTELMLST